MIERDPRQRDAPYMGFIASLPCAACMVLGKVKWGVHVAHLRAGSLEHGKRPTGGAEKPSDRWTLPLCPPHHVGDKRVTAVSQHAMGELDFWAAFHIDPFGLCLDLSAAYDRGGRRTEGVAVITKAAAKAKRIMEGDLVNQDEARAYYADRQRVGTLPTVALSIQQPWAWLIVSGHKPVENRTWHHPFRGRVLIHAGKKRDEDAVTELFSGRHPVTGTVAPDLWEAIKPVDFYEMMGGFVGVATVVDCVPHLDSPWFVGPFGFVLKDAQPLPFLPWRGMLGFFEAKVGS